jgi:RNA polymerase sigma-70 factor (ECF subfamily)
MQWEGVHQLIRQARAGDREALDRLYVLAQPYLLRLAQRLLGPSWPHESVSDLTQDTWLHALQGLGGFEGAANDADTGALFRAWLARTMKNARLNDVRFDAAKCRRGPLGTVPLDPAEPGDSSPGGDPPGRDQTPSENVRRQEQRTLIQQALHKLSEPDDWEIVRLRFFEELSFAEIGKRLGRDESTVRYHLQRILEYLGEELKGLQ